MRTQDFRRFMWDWERAGGLLLASTAAQVLGVSRKRVSELVTLGKLNEYRHFNHGWLSVAEVRERLNRKLRGELRVGRPFQSEPDLRMEIGQ